ncbi:MAG: acetyl-CoA hydrolase/transferase family protein [Bacteroidetes bacterium]|nr:MAG: acetyl-CoA hydrolase/transferase family protein [Bacteroidota bacterium]REJ99986.1 MAG: acetyl-CoA hydrolase/transferase family protein [Bacteroidota bacterium]REK35834.1 MAG: acetyl-CoA hydrolase/transferase family protein [Bacteroidota bacterium]REK49295.1 MAG: acetyl-CoA hydrolase/transferase family protein [Bacteroidota bacterium]
MRLNYSTAEEAISAISNNSRLFIHGSAATPLLLIRTLMKRAGEIKNVELVSISTLGENIFDVPEFDKSFFINSLFVSRNIRELVNADYGDYSPVFLSEIHLLFEKGILPLDASLIHVSIPDKHGFCSLGTSIDIARSAVRHSKLVIAQVNPKMPRTHGDSFIHIKDIDYLVQASDDLPEVSYTEKINDSARTIGKFCAELIDDKSCLQLGIGSIPDAVLSCLHNHKDLGIHTEMFSDGLLPLVEKGIITNRYKKKHRGKIVTGFVIGTRRLYDFVDDNPQVSFLEVGYVNDTKTIRANPDVVAINSALEIDITGQVCSDSLGTYQYSGVGGQMDFMRGAALSERGKPVIAMPSVTAKGESKIVPFLKQGSSVVTTRAHVHYVITEYGVVNLFGKTMHQRAAELLKISHPDHREWIEREIHKRFGKSAP